MFGTAVLSVGLAHYNQLRMIPKHIQMLHAPWPQRLCTSKRCQGVLPFESVMRNTLHAMDVGYSYKTVCMRALKFAGMNEAILI